MLHALGKTYGERPSAFASGLDEMQAFVLDGAALKAGSDAEDDARQRHSRR